MTTQTETPAATSETYLNINEASKACGLSPSVLRIWELRYGWPNPKRKGNGYRAYSMHLIDDLRRVSKLVKDGTPIRQIIVDGLPQWPAEDNRAPVKPKTLEQIKPLAETRDRTIKQLRQRLLSGVTIRNAGPILEVIDRSTYQLRPMQEAEAVFLPALIGLAEQELLERPFSDSDVCAVLKKITPRADQLLGRLPADDQAIAVVPASTEERDIVLAKVIALVINGRGTPARVADAPNDRCLIVGHDLGIEPGKALAAITPVKPVDLLLAERGELAEDAELPVYHAIPATKLLIDNDLPW